MIESKGGKCFVVLMMFEDSILWSAHQKKNIVNDASLVEADLFPRLFMFKGSLCVVARDTKWFPLQLLRSGLQSLIMVTRFQITFNQVIIGRPQQDKGGKGTPRLLSTKANIPRFIVEYRWVTLNQHMLGPARFRFFKVCRLVEFCLEANPLGLGLETSIFKDTTLSKSAPFCENTMRIYVKHPGSETPLHWMGGSVLSWVSPFYFEVLTLQHQKSRKRQVLKFFRGEYDVIRIPKVSRLIALCLLISKMLYRDLSTVKTYENDAPLDLHY